MTGKERKRKERRGLEKKEKTEKEPKGKKMAVAIDDKNDIKKSSIFLITIF